MPRQINEDPAVLQDRRKSVVTRGVESSGGGKGIPVNEQASQLELRLGTAEEPERKCTGADCGTFHRWRADPHTVPKPKRKDRSGTPATMEEVTECLREAFRNVAGNRGAPGPDGKTIAEVGDHLDMVILRVTRALLSGTYEPGNIRRVWIPKSGGQRGLGIPNVVDRMVQEAVRMVLEPLYEPTFHPQSHGFRPGRSCHTAIAEARGHVEAGCEWVVDLDLEKFFDRVHHQRLMARLAQRVNDRRLLALVGHMLKAKVVMPNGVVVGTEEGVPQGGPLSPLLSNIVLDELDSELARRGHRFVRYADDCNIYVRSERAGQRVMASVVRFIKRRLRLEVNWSKSAVARPKDRHFVGFRLWRSREGRVEVLLSERTVRRAHARISELTPRNWGGSLRACIRRLNGYLKGWLGFFGIATAIKGTLRKLDAHIRHRLRAIQLKHWKRPRTIIQRLANLGVALHKVRMDVCSGRKSIWALSRTRAANWGLRNSYFEDRGLVSLVRHWEELRHKNVVAPEQLMLALG